MARKPACASTSPRATNVSPATSRDTRVPSTTAASESVAKKRRATRLYSLYSAGGRSSGVAAFVG